ncbi:MAG: FKBP-type peptidyl-prolyl cis-trans isomerase [Saprospiraceae bacterium]|nr:FKBP-type peptidyl-prolyl cis-trans isomerase [Saprospiraceae bacterium]MCF8249891.1 FKBP-type peptidyl-prolyl cis-trans isomerase [Saprospiraceae bacterium]MCF8279304.1 FKBP-type peptidyl-prolyl cis-trans isomerase [Bacteroidales bacterium]MCF8309995.1 FKBP-type peptidyl-prolyl cis-trans isomerase [Saprospiraceae bacterium]MCF8438895.1 FKBP-type peptidyl-prolyl cis-trans isomerase [Saprospiraceae bacterium]
MVIEQNTVVSLHYRLTVSEVLGELVEETFGSEPLVFLYGAGQMIPEFERQLAGKASGDQFSFGIKSEEAYGAHDPNAVVQLPMSTFEVDGEVDKDMLKIGTIIPMSDDQGNRLNGMVKEVSAEGVMLDFNHPMAGTDLHFTGTVESLRAATPTEMEHGHVHGPGGHNH